MASYYETLTDEKKAAYETAVKERFAKKGFDPEDMWAWMLRVFNGKPVTLREFQQKVFGEATRRGWFAEANLDYEPSPVSENDDIPLPDGWWEIRAWPNFGASEGIYIDFELRGHYCGADLPALPDSYGLFVERVDRDDPSKGYDITYRLHCAKTLDDDFAGMERMGKLTGLLLWLFNEIPCG